ncbi:hypothetical protein GBAR_LOCUS15497 [Geodia barretti]|uniref:Uncharacterized protein n=1 Tax=Geodia barretti TaxID=519541 RepID=A0AA35SDA7_GEOBA|nr:hypothetical protein GBAR_LOCUS15497 [Geodia barretti]
MVKGKLNLHPVSAYPNLSKIQEATRTISFLQLWKDHQHEHLPLQIFRAPRDSTDSLHLQGGETFISMQKLPQFQHVCTLKQMTMMTRIRQLCMVSSAAQQRLRTSPCL